MKTLNLMASACRHCRFYKPEGRRGGHCHQLDVPVRGCWRACSLAIPQFSRAWETLEGVLIWENDILRLQDVTLRNQAPVDYSMAVEGESLSTLPKVLTH